MPAPTKFSDINLVTSMAGYFANQLTAGGWAVYWQARGVLSGTAVVGEVTIVPEFPAEPSNLVIGPRTRTQSEVIVPAFAVSINVTPHEEVIAGLGEDSYETATEITIDGFVETKAQHMAFSTLFRNWFRKDTYIPIYDWEGNAVTPNLVEDRNLYVRDRQVEVIDSPNLPNPVRYYINMTAELVFYD